MVTVYAWTEPLGWEFIPGGLLINFPVGCCLGVDHGDTVLIDDPLTGGRARVVDTESLRPTPSAERGGA